MIEVFAWRRNAEERDALVERIRSEGGVARPANSQYFEPDQIDKKTERVYHDGEEPLIPYTYEQHGIPCEIIPGFRGEVAHGAEEPEYRVEKNGAWYSLIGPDGKVGKSQRSEDDAWALLDEESA